MSARKAEQLARFIARDLAEGLHDPAYQIIIRATWERGERQEIALRHLKERGLWLTEDQKRQAGIL